MELKTTLNKENKLLEKLSTLENKWVLIDKKKVNVVYSADTLKELEEKISGVDFDYENMVIKEVFPSNLGYLP